MSDDEIKQILRPATPVNFHVPTSDELRHELREKIGVMEAKNESLLIENRNLATSVGNMHEIHDTLCERLDSEIADNRRLRATLEAIAELQFDPRPSFQDWYIGKMRDTARKALEPQA